MELGMDLGLLLIRLAVGLPLAAHGLQKLFGWFGGYGLEGTGGFMASLGFVPGRRNAAIAGLGETAGGVLLALGLLTPLGAAVVVAVMITASASAHAGKGFFNTGGGWELPFVFGAAAAALAFTGAGEASLDHLLDLELGGWEWGIGAVAFGTSLAMLRLATRRFTLDVDVREPEQAAAQSDEIDAFRR